MVVPRIQPRSPKRNPVQQFIPSMNESLHSVSPEAVDGLSESLSDSPEDSKIPNRSPSPSPCKLRELTTEPTSHLRWSWSFTSLPFPIYHTFPTISGRRNWGFRSWKISLWLPTYFGLLKSSTREETVGGQVAFNTHVSINITWNVPSLNRNF